jgi:hypothetical protein
MLMHLDCTADIERKIEIMQSKYKLLNLKLQPFICAIGPSREKDTELAQAIDLCFKAVYVSNLEYQVESKHVWTFYQFFFFFFLVKKISGEAASLTKQLKSKMN